MVQSEQQPIEEVWMPAVYQGTATRYEISNFGDLRNAHTGKYVKPNVVKTNIHHEDRTPYNEVRMWIGGQRKSARVAKLVIEAFVGPRPAPGWTIEHINQDSLDDRASNLMWVPHGINVKNSVRHRKANGTFKHGWRILHPQIHALTKQLYRMGLTQGQISLILGIRTGTVSKITRNLVGPRHVAHERPEPVFTATQVSQLLEMLQGSKDRA